MTQLFSTRAMAKATSADRYFTGKPCRRGHVSERYTANGHCVECQRLRNQTYLPEWQETNRVRMNLKSRAWYLANREHHNLAGKNWRQKNRDRFREQRREHYARNAQKLCQYFRARHAKRRALGTHTVADLKTIRRAQRGRCAYCRILLKTVKEHSDHIFPVAKGGSNFRRNIQLLCAACNLSKNDRDPMDFARSRGLLL